jgi:threonyl-tRNA synthetase
MLNEGDHRSLAQRLDLFHFQEEAPGMVFWHPRGFVLYRLLEEAVRAHVARQGYEEVRTPQVLRRAVWEASGHWQHFAHGMMRLDAGELEAALKPVSCPGHIQILKQRLLSYRDLPLRFSELGLVHRDEIGGALHGLLRLRQFTQDDGHVFCADEAQAEAEVERFCRGVAPFYAAFGFDRVSVALSLRPADRAGDDELWDRAEHALASVLERVGIPYVVQPGEGAFYGPKLEFVLEDRLGRRWQLATIQFDLVMPRRFDLRFVAASGERRYPVMLHRALYGSLERFLGILLEHHGVALPAWLAPQQVSVLPVSPAEDGYARELESALCARGLRGAVSASDESLSRRVAAAHEEAVPFVAIVGPREHEKREVTVRARGGQFTLPFDAAVASLAERCVSPPTS